MKFKFLAHTADVKFQGFGKTLEGAFENSALAVKETIAPGIKVEGRKEKQIKVKGNDLENLLYVFLEEILYFLDAEDFLISEIKNLKIDKKSFELKCVFLGDRASDYKFSNDVKAVTYNEMFVRHEAGKWICQVVLDV